MTENPFTFPIHISQETYKIRSMPAVEGTSIKNTVVTETAYPEGNSTRQVTTYSVIIYDATGRLNSDLFGYGSIDKIV